MAKVNTTDWEWFELWLADKKVILATMHKNMQSDIEAGYNVLGNSIKKQVEEIDAYRKDIDSRLDIFSTMEDDAVARWCYYDMKKRGVID